MTVFAQALPSSKSIMFPPDVIDYIFNLLKYEDAILRECSKAHPLLASIAERHLYVHVALQNQPTRNDPKFLPSDILKVFAEKPEILNHVIQGLSIELLPLPKAKMDRSLEDMTSVLSTVAGIPRLRSITLKGRSAVAWRNLDKAFRNGLLNCVHSPFVTDVSIQNIVGFDLSKLVGGNLKHLSLRGRFSLNIGTLQATQLNSIPEFKFLSLSDFRPLRNIITWKPLRNLRALDFHSSNIESFDSFKDLLNSHFYSLTRLRFNLADLFQSSYNLDNGYQTSPNPPLIRLPFEFGSLQQVTFHAISSIKTSSRLYFSTLPEIANSLHSVPFVEHVILRLHFEVEDSFFLHRSDALYIRAMLGTPNSRGRAIPSYTRNIDLHISAANQDGTIPPSEILTLVKHDQHFKQLLYSGYVRFTAEGHFCKHFSCCGPLDSDIPWHVGDYVKY